MPRRIPDYAQQFASRQFRDPLLRMLATPDLESLGVADRKLLLATCFRSNHTTMLAPFPQYKRLHEIYLLLANDSEATYCYLSGAYFSDLVTWYHLAWTGETERRRNPLLAKLMSQGEGYDVGDRRQLLDSIGELITGLIRCPSAPPIPADAAASSPISMPRASAMPVVSAHRRSACGRRKVPFPGTSSGTSPPPTVAGSPAVKAC